MLTNAWMKYSTLALMVLLAMSFAQAGEWSNTVHAAAVNNQVLSIDTEGNLWRTVGTTGQTAKIGPPQWGTTRLWVGDKQYVYSIDQDGSLYVISPDDGRWKSVARSDAFTKMRIASAHRGHLYGILQDGSLVDVALESGQVSPIGATNWQTSRLLMAGAEAIFSIDEAGSLSRIDPKTGESQTIGGVGAWKTTSNATVIEDSIYSVSSDGSVYVTDGKTGSSRVIKEQSLKGVEHMFADDQTVFTIYGEGKMERGLL